MVQLIENGLPTEEIMGVIKRPLVIKKVEVQKKKRDQQRNHQ